MSLRGGLARTPALRTLSSKVELQGHFSWPAPERLKEHRAPVALPGGAGAVWRTGERGGHVEARHCIAGCWAQRRGCWWLGQTGASASDSESCRQHQARLPLPRGVRGRVSFCGQETQKQKRTGPLWWEPRAWRGQGLCAWPPLPFPRTCGTGSSVAPLPSSRGQKGLLPTDASPACWLRPNPHHNCSLSFPLQRPIVIWVLMERQRLH